MKKLLVATIISVFALSACTSATNNNISNNDDFEIDEDTVLWVNADGTDCDYGDWLEGDKDCDKKKKNTYVDTKSLNKKAKTTKTTKKSPILKSSNKKKSDKKKYGKKSTKKSSKRK